MARRRRQAHELERVLGGADRAHAVVDAAGAEARLGDHEAVALACDQGGGGDAGALEDDFGVALLVDEAELKQRQAALKPAVTPEWAQRGYAHLFNETILQADEGCDFDFMRAKGKGA